MDSLSLISPSIVLPPMNPLRHHRRRRRFTVSPSPIPHRLPSLSSLLPVSYSPEPSGKRLTARGAARDENDGVESGKEEEEDEEEEVERALRMEGGIPGTSNEFVERVSSRAYDMRRSLQQTFESSSYDAVFGFHVLSVSRELNKVNSSGITIFATELNNVLIKLPKGLLTISCPFFIFFSFGNQPMERNFKACICTDPQGKPVMHNENPNKSQVCHGFMQHFHCIAVTIGPAQVIFFMAVKLKESLDYCFLKVKIRCVLRMLERECYAAISSAGLTGWLGEKGPFLACSEICELEIDQKLDLSSSLVRKYSFPHTLLELVFEDEKEASNYCDLLEGGGQGCEGIAEIEASSVFDLCRRMGALAVLFRRGRTPPVPENLDFNLRARKRSLEDQEDII
ncbi:hypothetical protein RHSIM_Rhsim12G0078900 [Rhododendron simsii]|uniref:Uncharacterized protein n=1 Tax=Rhododendron simsii TaxID=118357 RepID=A0A834G2I1_RHOSS|nr:hypothetical protein RHSIM_Rhsim12G0078900 [Rhododendron simsii]